MTENLPSTQTTGFHALSAPQQQEHRVKVGARCEAILRQFYREDTPDAILAFTLEGWIDVLQYASHDEIRNAWAEYQRSGPRSKNGTLKRPDAGALWQIISRRRPRPAPVRVRPEQKPARVSKEAAAEILREVGFNPKMFGGKADA